MEIEEQADPQATHAEIGKHLRVVCRHELGNRFDFDDHLASYKNVGAEAFVELYALVSDRNSDLPLEGDSSLRQLVYTDSSMPGPVLRCTSIARPMTRSVSSRASSMPICLRAALWSFVASVLKA
jgi:hypothetical protein